MLFGYLITINTNNMKKLAYLMLLFFGISCQLFDFPKTSLVRLQNDSNFDIKIAVFEKGNLLIPDTISLEKGKFLERKQLPKDSFEPFLPIEADSIIVIFDSRKILTQYCNRESLNSLPITIKCNIINNLVYYSNTIVEEFKTGKYERRVTYKITNDDYDWAVDIVK